MTPKSTDGVTVFRRPLEFMYFGCERLLALTPQEVEMAAGKLPLDTGFETRLDVARRSLVLTLRSRLLRTTQAEPGTGTYKFPATWWQHFKLDHFPEGLLKRFPIRYTTATYSYEKEIHVCPHADRKFDHPSHIEFLTFTTAALPLDNYTARNTAHLPPAAA